MRVTGADPGFEFWGQLSAEGVRLGMGVLLPLGDVWENLLMLGVKMRILVHSPASLSFASFVQTQTSCIRLPCSLTSIG